MDLNGAEAAVRAGCRATSGKGTARRLLQRADLHAGVAVAEQRQLASAGLSDRWRFRTRVLRHI
jgi:hypothetical protein